MRKIPAAGPQLLPPASCLTGGSNIFFRSKKILFAIQHRWFAFHHNQEYVWLLVFQSWIYIIMYIYIYMYTIYIIIYIIIYIGDPNLNFRVELNPEFPQISWHPNFLEQPLLRKLPHSAVGYPAFSKARRCASRSASDELRGSFQSMFKVRPGTT